MSNVTFPFYTSTAQQDANRVNTPSVRLCPRERLIPFQIRRSHNTSAVTSVKLINCDGAKTDITSYFSSVGTTIATSSVGVQQYTNYDYIFYSGGPLNTELPYGVYFLEVIDNAKGEWYSEHFSVRDLNQDYLTSWSNGTYDTWASSGVAIGTAISTGTGGASSNSFTTLDIHTGDTMVFSCGLTLNSGQLPSIEIRDSSANTISNTVELVEGYNDYELTYTKSAGLSSSLRLISTGAASFSISFASIRRNYGDYVKLDFRNSDDLIHQHRESIMYKNDWKQTVYFDTRLNNPTHEFVEIGEELEGVFISEQLNSIYIYNIIDYVSRSLYNGLTYLPMHDDITITDEVGNTYSPDVGNVAVAIDWTTFDTGTVKIEFNDGSMDWVNDQNAIT